MRKQMLAILLVLCLLVAMVPGALAAPGNEAAIGSQEYSTLAEAITAANGISGGATITLLKDVAISTALKITGNVTIKGNYTITRGGSNQGTIFNVSGGKLTLDGGVTVDGGNNFTYDLAGYYADQPTNSAKTTYATSAAGGIIATDNLIKIQNGGSMELLSCTLTNNFTNTSEKGVFYLGSGSTLTMGNGSKVVHNYVKGSSGVVNCNGNWYIKDGALIDDNHSEGGNGGISYVHGGSKVVMEGGTVSNNTILGNNANGSGSFIMLYKNSSFTMTGGVIEKNASFGSGGWGGVIYVHYTCTGTFEMDGGIIQDNKGYACTAVTANGEIKYVLKSGTIRQNDPYNGKYSGIFVGPVDIWEDMTISGGSVCIYSEGVEDNNIDGTINADIQIYAGSTVSFTGSGTVNGNVKLEDGSKVTIEGGNWNGEFTVPSGTKLTIKDGTFKYDPSDYVADGFVAVRLPNGTYRVFDEDIAAEMMAAANVPVPETGDHDLPILCGVLALISLLGLALVKRLDSRI